MGTRISQFFTEAERIAGFAGKVRLAALTGLTSAAAGSVEDSEDLVSHFSDALAKIRRELGAGAPTPAQAVVTGASDANVLRRHISVYLDLMSQRALVLGDIAETVRHVDEAAANALDVARVSVWFLDAGRSKITCADLYERASKKHSEGVELMAKDFPTYFHAIEHERTIAAHDAHTDPRTACFSAPYLAPLGIGAMLDVPIMVGGKMVGVVCHEHVGGARHWNTDEERFAYLMANFVSLAMERAAAV